MKRHLIILAIYYRASVMSQMEYRDNFATSLVLSHLWPFWVMSLLWDIF